MAQVLLARTTGIGGFERYVVVKRIHTEHAADERFVRMFLDEARLAAMLHHGNIVQVHEVGEQEDGRIYFAMEYVHGEELRQVLRNLNVAKEKMPLDHVVAIVCAAADALHHAHEQRSADGKPLGLVHRDITPANIIVGYDGIVKVVDFGIAKAALRSTETAGGTLKGKVGYMSPEQCLGKPVDRRSDVYSLGVVLYEAVCVRRLFKNENDFLTMSSILAAKIPPPSDHRRDLPEELGQIIMKALAVRPEDRYQTAAEMAAALEQFASNAGLRPSPKALAAFLRQRFGSRPEPWLVDGAPEVAVTDFDGSERGLATAPLQALENLAIPAGVSSSSSAPIMQARKKAFASGSEVIAGRSGSTSRVDQIRSTVSTWFRTTLPAWARRTLPPWLQQRERQLAACALLLLLLVLVVFFIGRPSRMHLQPQLPPAAAVVTPTPESPPTAGAAAQPVATGSATKPATTPVPKPAVKAPAKPVDKKKRPKPKFLF